MCSRRSLVTLTGAQSLSNKTLVTPTITGPTINPVTAGPNALALTVGAAQVRANGNNVALGSDAQQSLTTGSSNVALGFDAQQSLTTGSSNVALGYAAQQSLTTGSNNVAWVSQQLLTTVQQCCGRLTRSALQGVAQRIASMTTASRVATVRSRYGSVSDSDVCAITSVGARTRPPRLMASPPSGIRPQPVLLTAHRWAFCPARITPIRWRWGRTLSPPQPIKWRSGRVMLRSRMPQRGWC